MTACQSSELNVYQVACCQNHRIMASGPSAKRKRKDFTVSEKVQVIEYKKENPNAMACEQLLRSLIVANRRFSLFSQEN